MHDVRQTDGIGRAVMHTGQCREWVRERVRRSEVFLKRHPAHRRRHQHLSARLDIVSVGDRARQSFHDHPNTFERDAITHRIEVRRSE